MQTSTNVLAWEGPPSRSTAAPLETPAAPADTYDVMIGILHYDVRPIIPPDQAWLAEWQEDRENEADADFHAGRSKTFDSAEDFLSDLDDD